MFYIMNGLLCSLYALADLHVHVCSGFMHTVLINTFVNIVFLLCPLNNQVAMNGTMDTLVLLFRSAFLF